MSSVVAHLWVALMLVLARDVEADADEEAINVFAELSELDMEDACAARAALTAALLRGQPTTQLAELIGEDTDMHTIMSWTSAKLTDKNSYDLDAILQRKLDLLSKRGDYRLERNSWDKFTKFIEETEQNITKQTVACKGCNYTLEDINAILSNSLDVPTLKETFDCWNKNGTPWSLSNLFDSISITIEAAEENGMSSVREYWESLSEMPDGYNTANELWEQIRPFYKRLHEFIVKRLISYHGDYVLDNTTDIIPSYLLGSVEGLDWGIKADILLPHPHIYKKITDFLSEQQINGERMYLLAQNLTNSLGLGNASDIFWKKSSFNESCPSHLIDFCQSGNAIVITCSQTRWQNLVDAYETFMRIMHSKLAADGHSRNSYLLRYGSRYSGVYEAVPQLPLLFITKSHHFVNAGILNYKDYISSEENMYNHLSLILLNALHVLPKLPYYLAVDAWRLEILERSQESKEDLTNEDKIELWKNIRRNYTLVDSYDYEIFRDSHILENKPYLAKFFGGVLQFQLFSELIREVPEGVDIEKHQVDDGKLSELMRSGLAQEWMDLLMNLFYIYSIEPEPLLEFYAPLESYFEEFSSLPQEIPTTTVIDTTQELTTEGVTTRASKSSYTSRSERIANQNISKNVMEQDENIYTSEVPFILMILVAIVLVLVVLYVINMKRKEKKRKARRNKIRA